MKGAGDRMDLDFWAILDVVNGIIAVALGVIIIVSLTRIQKLLKRKERK
jgi:hypothetical protein